MYGWKLDHKEGWAWNRIAVLEKILGSPFHSKEIKLVNSKGNQSWIFIGRADNKIEAPILWPPDTKSWLIRKNSDAEKDWRQEKKGAMEDEMVGWHHWLNGHEFEQALGDSEGQGSLVCCGQWGHKESDRTEWLNTNTTTPSDQPQIHERLLFIGSSQPMMEHRQGNRRVTFVDAGLF